MTNWTKRKIEEVINPSLTVVPQQYPEKQFSYVDGVNISNKTFQIEKSQNLLGSEAPNRPCRVMSYGDVIFVMTTPTLMRVAIVPEELDGGICSSDCFVFQAKDELYNRYLFYYLLSDEFIGKLEKEQSGDNYPVVNEVQIENQDIQFPSIEKQKHIVSFIDQSYAEIEQACVYEEEQLKEAREWFDSESQQIISQNGDGWILSTLGDDCDFMQGIQVNIKHQYNMKNKEQQVRFLRINDFIRSDESPIYINYPGHKCEVSDEDVLLVKNGTYSGFVCSGIEGVISNHLLKIIPDESKLTRAFLYFYLQSPIFQSAIKQAMSGAITPSINTDLIRKISTSYPSIVEQNAIIKGIKHLRIKLDSQEASYISKIKDYKEQKNAILQKAFSGKLTPRVVK